jgi:hypothetical protein
MNSFRLREFDKIHVNALLDKLHRGHEEIQVSEKTVHRIFFVDSDILSVYINGRCTNYISSWPSLFGLFTADEGDRGNRPADDGDISEDAKDLSNRIARAVSQFVLGQFRESRKIQGPRLWMTPEQKRELDGIVQAVLAQQHDAMPEWHDAMLAHYQAMYEIQVECSPQQQQDWLKDKLSNSLKLLIDGSALGTLARTLQVKQTLVSAPTEAPIFPSLGPGSAFMFKADTPAFLRRTNEIASHLLQHWQYDLRKRYPNRDWHDVFSITEILLKFHQPTRKVGEYVGFIVGNEDLRESMEQGRDYEWLRSRALAGAREVSDIFTVARLATFVEELNGRHNARGELTWDVCLLSGSRRMERLINLVSKIDTVSPPRLVHPLSVMRFDQFLYPLASGGGSEEVFTASGKNFALDVILSGERVDSDDDAKEFLKHLKDLVTICGAAFAPQRDKSLRKIKEAIDRNKSLNISAYVRAVRNTIAHDFVRTYLLVNQLPSNSNNECLSMISLPWLSLPFVKDQMSAAEKYIEHLHDSSRLENNGSNDLLGQISIDDPTGYTLMLCASLGHLRQGRNWRKAAETLANSAAILALNMPEDIGEKIEPGQNYRAEGNEALYLCAFVSRMSVFPAKAGTHSVEIWRNKHRQTLCDARERVQLWQKHHPEVVAYWCPRSANIRRDELVIMRYAAEDLAREVFCWLMDILCNSEFSVGNQAQEVHLGTDEISGLLQSLCKQVYQARKIASHCDNLTESPELCFILGQLFVATAQAWISGCCTQHVANYIKKEQLAMLEQELIQVEKLLPSIVSESVLINGLRHIVHKHAASIEINGKGKTLVKPSGIVFPKFAEIDAIRTPLLNYLVKTERLDWSQCLADL